MTAPQTGLHSVHTWPVSRSNTSDGRPDYRGKIVHILINMYFTRFANANRVFVRIFFSISLTFLYIFESCKTCKQYRHYFLPIPDLHVWVCE